MPNEVILKIYEQPHGIHKSWFGNGHGLKYYNATGYYFTSPWSLMYWNNSDVKYNFNNRILTELEFQREFSLIECLPGTGGCVCIYTKN